MRKKGVALILAATLLWSLSAPAWAAENPFSDLRSDHWAFDSVIKLAAAGLIEGYPDGTFGGERMFTRYEMAMVFARILARFESLIDEKIEQGIGAKSAGLEQSIAATRDELTALIVERYEELRAAIARLDGGVQGVDEPAASGEVVPLTPEARAVLEELAAGELQARLDELASLRDVDELARRVVGLESGLSDLERRMLQLEGSTPTRAEAQMIAERVVADALGGLEPTATLAAQGDPEAMEELVEARANELAAHIDRMATEFRDELTALGVRVDDLERRMLAQEEESARQGRLLAEHEERLDAAEADIEDMRARLGTVRFSGSVEARFRHTAVEGDEPYLKDPRDIHSKTREPGNEFINRLRLNVSAEPAPNVDVKASLIFDDVFGLDEDGARPRLNFDLTTPGVLRSLHLGQINLKRTADASFDKYTLHRKAPVFRDDLVLGPAPEEYKVQGAAVNLVYGLDDSTDVRAFVSRIGDAEYLGGASVSYTLSDAFDLTFRGVRQTNSPQATSAPVTPYGNTTVSVESKGALASAAYGAVVATNWEANGATETSGTAIDAWVQAPLNVAAVKVEYAAVDSDFNPRYGKQLNSGQGELIDGVLENELPSLGRDWLERTISPPPDKVAQGQREARATLSAPLLGANAALAVGQRDDDAGVNNFTQVTVSNVDFAGLNIGLLYDRRVDEGDNVDNTVRATFGTTILEADVRATVHNRTNDQTWTGAEPEQRATWVSAVRDLELGIPLRLEGHFGINHVLEESATRLGVSTAIPVSDHLTLRAGYRTEANAVGDSLVDDLELAWWKNSEWTGNSRDVTTVGFDYTIGGVFGTELKTGYEYRLARVNGSEYGTARNTIRASFEKALRGGESLLSGEARYIIGGNPDEDPYGNDRDLVARLRLTYPVFESTNLLLGGEWVSSKGDRANEYDYFRLNAGLKVQF